MGRRDFSSGGVRLPAVGHQIDHDIADHGLDLLGVFVERVRVGPAVGCRGCGDLDEIVDDMTERDQASHDVPPLGRR